MTWYGHFNRDVMHIAQAVFTHVRYDDTFTTVGCGATGNVLMYMVA